MTNTVMREADELSSRLRIRSGKLKPVWARTKTQSRVDNELFFFFFFPPDGVIHFT